MTNQKQSSRPVYSTALGRLCPDCGNAVKACRCSQHSAAPSGDGVVRVSRQTKGRKGKGVTLITGIPLQGEALKACAAELRQLCATGGAVKGDVVEIQGDHRDRVIEVLSRRGWTVKRSGG